MYSVGSSGWELSSEDRGCHADASEVAGTKVIFAPEEFTLALRCRAGMVPSAVPAVFDADL